MSNITKKIIAKLGLDDSEFTSRLEAATKKLNMKTREMTKEARRLSITSREIFYGLTVPMALFGKGVVDATREMDKMTKGLTLIAQSRGITAIDDLLKKTTELAKLPGLGLRETFKGVQQLLAVGLGAKDSLRVIEGLGIGIARAGGSAENFGLVMTQLTQALSKGKLQMNDFRTVFEQMPEARRILEDAFGPGMSDLDRLRKSGKTASDVVFALADGFRELGAGDMMNSLSNRLENLGDAWFKFRAALGKGVFADLIADGLNSISNALEVMTDKVQNMSPKTKDLIEKLAKLTIIFATVVPALGFLRKTWLLVASSLLGTAGLGAVTTRITAFLGGIGIMPGQLKLATGALIAFGIGAKKVFDSMNKYRYDPYGLMGTPQKLSGASDTALMRYAQKGKGSSLGFLDKYKKPATEESILPPILPPETKREIKATADEMKGLEAKMALMFPTISMFGESFGKAYDDMRDSTEAMGELLFAGDRNKSFVVQLIPSGDQIALMKSRTEEIRKGVNNLTYATEELTENAVALKIFGEGIKEMFSDEIVKGIDGLVDGLSIFVDTALSGAPDAFGAMAKSFKQAIGDMLVSLAKLIVKLAIAFALYSIFLPSGATAGLKGFFQFLGKGGDGSFLGKILKGITGFTSGGIVGGNSPYGDKILARVNSGEMVLNKRQQAGLYSQLQGSTVRLTGEFIVRGRDLVYVLEENQKQLNGAR